MIRSLFVKCLLVSFIAAIDAHAEPPSAPAPSAPAEKAKPPRKRRASQHDQARTQAVKGARIHVIDDVIIVGRPQRPLSVLETSTEPFRFPVGTARYSKRDRQFLPAETQERW